MRNLSLTAAFVATVSSAIAAPVTSNALLVPAGPSALDVTMGLVWIAECPLDNRLVGVHLLRVSGVSGVVAICAPLQRNLAGGVAWAGQPETLKGPPTPPAQVMVSRDVTYELHGRISWVNDRGAYEERAVHTATLVLEETNPDPSFPAGPPVIAFKRKSQIDLMCPQNAFVKGIRYDAPDAGGVTNVELACADNEQRVIHVAWVPVTKQSKTKAASAERNTAHLQRIDCEGMKTNPDDGEAVDAIFGTLDTAGQVQSIGLSCAPTVEPADVTQGLRSAMAK